MDLYSLDRAYARSKYNIRRIVVTSINTAVPLVPEDDKRLALRVWGQSISGAPGYCVVRPRNADGDSSGGIANGFLLIRNNQLPVTSPPTTLTPNAAIAGPTFAGPLFNGAITQAALPTTGMLDDAASTLTGNIDPVTGDVNCADTESERSITLASDVDLDATADISISTGDITLPTFTLSGPASVNVSLVDLQELKMTLRDDGAIVRCAYDVVISGGSYIIHVLEAIAEECCLRDWSISPYTPNVHPKVSYGR